MDKERIHYLLYTVPENVDYTELPEELDLEDIPQERIDGLIELLSDEDAYYQFQAARILTEWGIEEGFEALVQKFNSGEVKGFIPHRLHSYDTTDEHILEAFLGYWTSKITEDKANDEPARKKIFPLVSEIIRRASTEYFSILGLLMMISRDEFSEYIPLIKKHLQQIIDSPDRQYWKIHDAITLLLTIDPDFVHELLAQKQKQLSDFGIKEA